MRGKASRPDSCSPRPRITPAYAGKSGHRCGRGRGRQDHPRLCGEKYWSQSRARPMAGSPPPMRGKGFALSVLPPPVGITPAYAGKSIVCGLLAVFSRDHPRLCGEKYSMWLACGLFQGSPPPMRGKGNVKCVIVACVEDHPRLCGEKPKPCPRFQQPSGSPPPMRGKASPHSCRKSYAGITPAYAGKRKKQKGS